MKVDNIDLDNAIYRVLGPELERLEHDKVLFSNGHHVAQRLVPLVRAAVQEVLERGERMPDRGTASAPAEGVTAAPVPDQTT